MRSIVHIGMAHDTSLNSTINTRGDVVENRTFGSGMITIRLFKKEKEIKSNQIS
jgi:hypothetical protein